MSKRKVLIIIPARMASTRLPGKPLADIQGAPMIVQVWRRAMESGEGRVVVAAAEPEIAAAITSAGGEAVLTWPGHPSGTDRIFEAATKVDPNEDYDAVINLQGDLPTLEPQLVSQVIRPLEDRAVDLATLVTPIRSAHERGNPNVVKAVVSWPGGSDEHIGRALYFTRAESPWGEGELYHHIGIYGWRREGLKRFVKLPPSPLELREKLEQLRALEHEMKIAVVKVATAPLGVDTPEDLARARAAHAKGH